MKKKLKLPRAPVPKPTRPHAVKKDKIKHKKKEREQW